MSKIDDIRNHHGELWTNHHRLAIRPIRALTVAAYGHSIHGFW